MTTQTGIWLDLRNAFIIHLPPTPGAEADVIHIESGIYESAHGDTGAKADREIWIGDEKRVGQQERELLEKRYFQEIIGIIRPHTTDLVIFGPSEAKNGLNDAIDAIKDFPLRTKTVKTADKMSQAQMVAWVRDFYDQPAPRRLPERP